MKQREPRTPFRDTYLALVLSRRSSKIALWTLAFLACYLLDIPAKRWVRATYARMVEPAATPAPVQAASREDVEALQDQVRRLEAALAARATTEPTPTPVTMASAPYVPPTPRPAPTPHALHTRPRFVEVTPTPPPSLPEGTVFTVSLEDVIATDRNEPGDPFAAVLTDDLVAQGRVVAEAQSRVAGRIVDVQKGKDKEAPVLTLALESVQGTDGPIRVATLPLVIRGKKQSKLARILRGVGGAAVGVIAGKKAAGKEGAIAGGALGAVVAMRGDAVELGQGVVVQFEVGEPAERPVATAGSPNTPP